MVRRTGVASADSGADSSGYVDDTPAWPGTDRPKPSVKAPWSGSGGRWTIWPMRIVLWAAILIVLYRGVMAIALNETSANAGGNGATGTRGTQFPVTLAEAYAMQFGRVYFNFSQAGAAQRQQQLGEFLPPSVLNTQSRQFGINGSATTQLESETVAGIDVNGSQQSAVVTLLTMINGRLMEFGVPVYAPGGGIVISGLPALLPAPAMAGLPQRQQAQPDPQATSQLQQQLPAFFGAYANGDSATLSRYLAPGASITGLGGEVTFGNIVNLYVPPGGATRDIIATVNWLLAGQQGGFVTTYAMSVVDLQGGKWYVEGIRASTQPVGTAQ
jgi:Conjugative transposon protein TcpC